MCSRTTVIQVLRQAEASGIQYPLPDGMSDKELTEKLYPSQAEKPVFKMPDYVYVHKELQKSGVTLKLLWLEYCEQCRNTGELAYGTAILPCRVRSPKDKAMVEGTVGVVSNFILAALRNRRFLSLPELNEAITERLYRVRHRSGSSNLQYLAHLTITRRYTPDLKLLTVA